MGTASSRLDEVQPPDDWQPSSNNVGFRLISPTSDISDPSCRIQQQQQHHKVSSMPASHLTPTLERRRTSKVVARNLPPRPRPVPTPSSFYFPTRDSEDMVDRKGIETKAQKAKRRQEEEASKRRLSKTKESIQKRALQAKQCLAACIEEPMHQIEKMKDRRAEARAESSKENVQNQAPKDLDLNYNRLSTDTTRSVNAAIAKGDIRKKKNKKKWEPKVAEISETAYMKAAPYEDDAEGHFSRRAPTPVPFEPVYRESHITMITTDQAGQAGAMGASTPLDPMFTVDIALHHEEAYFKRLSAASEYGVSPGVGFASHGEAKLPQPTPLRDHYISSPDSFGINASKEVMEAEIDSPVASLFMNDMFDSNPQDTKMQDVTIAVQPDDKVPPRSASAKAADSKPRKIDTKKAEVKASLNVPTERKSNASSVRLDPTEAEDWLTLGALVSPKATSLPNEEVMVDDKQAAVTSETNQSGKILVSTKMRKDSPFRPLVRGFGSKPFPIIKSLIAKSPSADYHPTENARQKKEPKLSTRSFDDYGAVHKLWLLPNVLAAAKAISGLDQGSGKGTPTMSRWKKSVMSPSEDSTHSSMMMSPGPLLTDQVLCNAAFLFSPSYVGGLDRLMPSRRSDSVSASHSPLANMITTHGSRSHLADYSRRSYPPVTIPISDSQQLLLRNSHEPRESSQGGSLDSKRVRFSLGDESLATSTTTKKSESSAPVGKDALAPALKKRTSDPPTVAFAAPETMQQRPSTASSVAFTGFQMLTTKSYDLDVSEESEILPDPVPPEASRTSTSPRRSSASSGTWPDQQKSVTFQAPSTPVASSQHGSPAGFSDNGTPDSFSHHQAEEELDQVTGQTKDRRSTDSNGSGSTASMYWSYRSVNGEPSAVTPMLGKKSAKMATNSPFLRFKAAKNRFSNPPTKTTPVRKAQKKLADVSNGGIVSSRVTEIDGRIKCTRPRSLKKPVMKRGSGVMTSRVDMVEKPVFRNPVIMGFKTASSFNEGEENRESLTVSLGRADQEDRRNSGGSYSLPESRRSSSSFPLNDAEKTTLKEVYQQLNRAPASSVGSARYSTVTESSSANNLQKVSTPSSVGPFMAFEGTPVSPDHSEATDITKRGTLRTPLQRNPEIFSSLKLSMSSAGVSPEPSPLGSYSVESGSSGLSSPFGALKLQEESFSHQSVDPSRLYERRDTISTETDVSEDMFATLIHSDGRTLLASSMVSDSSVSQEDSELDPFQNELIRPSIDESAAKSYGRHQLFESAPSQRSLLSETTSGESSHFSTLRRDASLRSLAAESHRSYASGSTTLSAIIQKENMSYLPFRAEAPVKPSQLRHHATPGALNLSPLQRTPMQASKWRTLAAAAHEKRKNQKQIKNGSSRGVLSERKSINQMTN